MKVDSLNLASNLFDESTFYPAFMKDLSSCNREIIIDSPYISSKRMTLLIPLIECAVNRRVSVYVLTRDPQEHTNAMVSEAESMIAYFETLGVNVFLCLGNDHRKLAIIDRKIIWEGSLNILSQTKSREIMFRFEGIKLADSLLRFTNIYKVVDRIER